jgi:hypothetical protein
MHNNLCFEYTSFIIKRLFLSKGVGNNNFIPLILYNILILIPIIFIVYRNQKDLNSFEHVVQ